MKQKWIMPTHSCNVILFSIWTTYLTESNYRIFSGNTDICNFVLRGGAESREKLRNPGRRSDAFTLQDIAKTDTTSYAADDIWKDDSIIWPTLFQSL